MEYVCALSTNCQKAGRKAQQLCALPLLQLAASGYGRCLYSVPMLTASVSVSASALCALQQPLLLCLWSLPLLAASAYAWYLCSVPMLLASTGCLCTLNLPIPLDLPLLHLPLPLLTASAHCLCLCLCSILQPAASTSASHPSSYARYLCPLPCSASAFNFSFFASYVMFFDCILIAATFPFRAFPPLMDIAHTQRATVHLCRPSHSLASSLQRSPVQLFTLI